MDGNTGSSPLARGLLFALCTLQEGLGSSPLARGLRPGPDLLGRARRIIPARAGFTSAGGRRSRRPPDHPRSRGVYSMPRQVGKTYTGSSPLARGLRGVRVLRNRQSGIIPARAGFTSSPAAPRRNAPDHPRSRGVYQAGALCCRQVGGSSPLARGLLPTEPLPRWWGRIIPARAGFTRVMNRCGGNASDHPRSRGVYHQGAIVIGGEDGSSPLARGLRHDGQETLVRVRIIPARAGFTGTTTWMIRSGKDHPRSRGVYTCGSLESQRRATLPDRVCLHCRPSARSAELR